MIEDRLTLNPNKDGQSKTDEEDDKHEDKVALGECVEPHGRQPVEQKRSEDSGVSHTCPCPGQHTTLAAPGPHLPSPVLASEAHQLPNPLTSPY